MARRVSIGPPEGEIVTMNTFVKPIAHYILGVIMSTSIAAIAASAGEPAGAGTNSGDVSRQLVLPGTRIIIEPGAFAIGSEPTQHQAALKGLRGNLCNSTH